MLVLLPAYLRDMFAGTDWAPKGPQEPGGPDSHKHTSQLIIHVPTCICFGLGASRLKQSVLISGLHRSFAYAFLCIITEAAAILESVKLTRAAQLSSRPLKTSLEWTSHVYCRRGRHQRRNL